MLRRWRWGAGLVFTFGLVVAVVGGATLAFSPGSSVKADAPPFKVTICHATDADNNPYTRNTVSFNSIADARDVNGHGDHTGPIWVAGDQAAKIKWGDIIPAYYYPTGVSEGSTFHYSGMNWTAQGEAIWNNSCNIPAPTPSPSEKKPVVVTTVVFDATSNTAWAGTEQAGASAYDTARVVPPSVFPVPTGTVTYIFYSTADCVSPTALGTDHSTVTLAAGAVPKSKTESDLAAGGYSFRAIYSGDGNYKGATSPCEPFSVAAAPVGPVETTTSTVVFDASTNKAVTGMEKAGVSVYDTSKVSAVENGEDHVLPTGSVTYRFWTNGTCSGDFVTAGADLALGTNSTTEGPLPKGDFSFQAVFTSSNTDLFKSSTSVCEPFDVDPASVTPSPTPTPTATPTATPSGGVLAATGTTTPGQAAGLLLIVFGLLAMTGGALAWRRREA